MIKANFTKRTLVICLILTGLLAFTGCGQEKATTANNKAMDNKKIKLVIAGSGTNLPGINKLAQKFMAKNRDIKIEVPESIGSTGATKSVNENTIDIGLLSRKLLPEEKNFGLEYIPYSRVLITFAVNPTVNIDNLSDKQILDIYTGKIRNWREVGGPDKEIVVLNREKNDSSRLVFNQYIKGFQDMAINKEAAILKTDQQMNEAIVSISDSIGWTDKGSVEADDLKVRMLNVNGAEPSETSYNQGKYPYIKELAFVTKGKPDKNASRFIDFVFSEEGAKILRENGYIPVAEK